MCDEAKALTDANGAYLKTFCLINAGYTYASAEQLCLANNMRLFTIENAAEQTALLTYSETKFGYAAGPNLFVNGQKDENGVWTSSNPTAPLFSGMKWYGGAPGNTGNCLTVGAKGTYQPFYVLAANCAVNHSVYCEYK